ncbi:hypothetical protein ABQF17_02340 [Mycolicibacterium elephantis]|uniref:Uncharacterized protein n=1 Tax=Mycolicibacterium elephantis TaxID=81858 RepID=A0A0M2ZKA2_9MYCO|nr:hypothetical protein [Mycolicibacterium elephantis]KKW65946.1 hypothetical protein AAV95_04400 [Mycolicibacterium elephantis]OBA90719.1 hypothetical protein A5633_04760 [Mycolicibacterium elephantis]OBB24500.1 hypothetical protein A5762_11255 [Mycolicibacterium elephantis]OBE94744.1 hypothetical protein A5776_22730 [Mycolicibacterium elephantis]ORA64950.1 hypothetical protein BST23_15555 [Mycolicibacterium elephantis]
MTTSPTRTTVGFVEVTLVVFGIYALGIGLFMMFAPGTFFDTLGNFGIRNDHYIFDNASFEVPQGLMLLAAVRWRTWRVPALAFATLHWALHTISHIVDPHHGAGDWVGWLEAGGLAVTTVILAIALRASIVVSRAS